MEVRALARTRREREDRIGCELSSEFSGAQILRRAVNGAVESVEGCDYAGVSLRSQHGEVQTPAWTSPAVWVADAMQVALDDGPSLELMWIADYVTVDDLNTNQRWDSGRPSLVSTARSALPHQRSATRWVTYLCGTQPVLRPGIRFRAHVAGRSLFVRGGGSGRDPGRWQDRLRDGDGHPKPGQHGPGSDEVSVRI